MPCIQWYSLEVSSRVNKLGPLIFQYEWTLLMTEFVTNQMSFTNEHNKFNERWPPGCLCHFFIRWQKLHSVKGMENNKVQSDMKYLVIIYSCNWNKTMIQILWLIKLHKMRHWHKMRMVIIELIKFNERLPPL